MSDNTSPTHNESHAESSTTNPQPLPPDYTSIRSALTTLSQGDPSETISVPMLSRTVSNSIHNYNPFSRKQGAIKQSVVVRQMKREQYLKHYAKDVEGNFVGTASPAPDFALVFVPGKSADEDLKRQFEEVALGKQRIRGAGIGKWGMPVKEEEGDGTVR